MQYLGKLGRRNSTKNVATLVNWDREEIEQNDTGRVMVVL